MNKKSIITTIVAIVAIIAVFSGLLYKNHSEMKEMVEIFTEEKTALINEYQDLRLDYDSLSRYDTDLNNKLDAERERVIQLQEELKTVKATNARRIRELQTELTTLRTVMRSFITQIDSLNQTNKQLTAENKEMRSQVAQARQSYNALAAENKTLSEQVDIASRLEATNFTAEGLNYNEKKTSSVSKISKIKISYTIGKNPTAPVGMRTVYLRLTRPDGQLLMHSKTDVFQYEGSDINFSSKREVEYGGDATNTYIVYNVDQGELMAGSYNVELFCNGDRIGSFDFNLK